MKKVIAEITLVVIGSSFFTGFTYVLGYDEITGTFNFKQALIGCGAILLLLGMVGLASWAIATLLD